MQRLHLGSAGKLWTDDNVLCHQIIANLNVFVSFLITVITNVLRLNLFYNWYALPLDRLATDIGKWQY